MTRKSTLLPGRNARTIFRMMALCWLIMAQATTSKAQYFIVSECSGTPTGGLGTNLYGPMYSVATANAASRTAIIYPASQLGGIAGATLTSLYFHRFTTTGTMAGTPNYKIYLKEVSASDWGSGSPDWATETASATLVYDSDPAAIVGSAGGWKNFPFMTNFTYSGTQNLAVLTEYTNATASSAITWTYEYTAPCINTGNSNTTKYSNNTTGAPAATLGSSNYRRPYIAFDILLAPCATPAAQPTALNLAPSSSAVNISFTAASPASDKYLIVRTPGNDPLNTAPVDGTTYTAGGTLGNGTVINYSNAVNVNNTALSSNTAYTYTVFAANDFCSGGPLYNTAAPLTGSVSTTSALAYSWNATSGTADATLPGSWTPARNVPDVTDTLYFNQGGSSTATGLLTNTVAKIAVTNNTSVTAMSAATATVTIARELLVEQGSTLELSGTNGITLNFSSGTGATGYIAGNLNMSGTGTCTFNTANSLTTVASTGVVTTTNTGLMSSAVATGYFDNGATYNHARNGGSFPAANYHPASMINVTGITSTAVIPPAKVGTMVWNCPGQTVANSWSSTVDTIRGNLTVINTGTGRIEGGNSPDIQIAGDFTQTGGTFAVGNYTSGSGLVEVLGNVSLNAGTLLLSTSATGTAAYQFRALGVFTQIAGHTIDRLNTVASTLNTITFAGNSTSYVSIGGTVNNAISFTLNNPFGANLGGIIPINQNAVNTITAGAWTGTGSFAYNPTGSTLAYNGTANQTATIFEWPFSSGPASVTINKTAGTALALPFNRTITGTLTLTNGNIDLQGNELTIGNSLAFPGTISGTGGFVRNGTLTRWFTNTGLPTTPGTGIGYFPMGINSSNRAVSVYFNSATALSSGGTLSVSHVDIPGLTSGLAVTDGAYTIEERTNASWSFDAGNGLAVGAGNSLGVRITGGNLFTTNNVANIRVMQSNSVVGTHVAGTGTSPNFQASRTGLSLADLTTAPLYIGAASADIGSCLQPSAPDAGSITATSASLSWTEMGTATQWEIEYGQGAFTQGTGTVVPVTSNPFVLSPLSSGTAYSYFVRADCGGGDYSAWSVRKSFSTLLANDLPSGATTLTVNASCSGAPYTNAGASYTSNEPLIACKGAASGAAVWFQFTAPASGMIKATTDVTGNGLTDTRLGLFGTTNPGNPGDLSSYYIIACDDDNGNTVANSSTLYASGLTPGGTYYLSVDQWNGAGTGTFCLEVHELTAAMIAPTGACAASTQTPALRESYGGWISLVDDQGRLIANVKRLTTASSASTTTYTFTPSLYTNPGAVRATSNGSRYLDRNYQISTTTPAGATAFDVQFYFLDGELSDLQAVDANASLQNINVTRQSGTTCVNDYNPAAGNNTIHYQTQNGSANGLSWVQTTVPGFSNFFLHTGIYPLSIELRSIAAVNIGQRNRIDWTTASEREGDHFTVERSADGSSFADLGTVAARGESGNYSYYDESPLNGVNYYRLKLTDVSGQYSYSRIVTAIAGNTREIILSAYPNPASDMLSVEIAGNRGANGQVVLYDVSGKPVLSMPVSNRTDISLKGLASGFYLLKYSDTEHSKVIRVTKN